MMTDITSKRKNLSYRILSCFITVTFISNVVLPPGYAQLAPQTVLNLPAPGTMVSLSTGFSPALVKGLTIDPQNPLQFEFFISKGDGKLGEEAFKEESQKLIKYFLASLTVPEEELWVNLSPYEKDRIVPKGFGETEMGRDMLAQDYILKQLTASLMYPEKELGKKFWDEVYKKARAQYGTTKIPVDTFNKVWIVPDKAVLYEHGNSVFIVESHLKVMLEEDYMAVSHQSSDVSHQKNGGLTTDDRRPTTQIIREVIIPALEKEVNEGKSFATLRQIYHSSILAVWYKQNLQKSLLAQVYANQNKIKGIDLEDKNVKQKIYDQYLEAFKKGVYNYIKEDYDPATRATIPRKYFSGGTNLASSPIQIKLKQEDWDAYSPDRKALIRKAADAGEFELVRWAAVENATTEEIALATQKKQEPAAAASSPVDESIKKINTQLVQSDDFINDLNDRLVNDFGKGKLKPSDLDKARALSYEVDRRLSSRDGTIQFEQRKRPEYAEGETDPGYDRYNRVLEGVIQILNKDEYGADNVIVNSWGYTDTARKLSLKNGSEAFAKIFFAGIVKEINRLIAHEGHSINAPPQIQEILRQIGALTADEIEQSSAKDLADKYVRSLVDSEAGLTIFPQMQQKFYLFSAGPGTGKDAIWKAFQEDYGSLIDKLALYHSRKPRVDEKKGVSEKDGVAYHFRKEQELKTLAERHPIMLAWVNRQLQGLAKRRFNESLSFPSSETALNKMRTVLDGADGKAKDLNVREENGVITLDRPIYGLEDVFKEGKKAVVLEGGYGWFLNIKKEYPDISVAFIAPFSDEAMDIRAKNHTWLEKTFQTSEKIYLAYQKLFEIIEKNEGEVNLLERKDLQESIRQAVDANSGRGSSGDEISSSPLIVGNVLARGNDVLARRFEDQRGNLIGQRIWRNYSDKMQKTSEINILDAFLQLQSVRSQIAGDGQVAAAQFAGIPYYIYAAAVQTTGQQWLVQLNDVSRVEQEEKKVYDALRSFVQAAGKNKDYAQNIELLSFLSAWLRESKDVRSAVKGIQFLQGLIAKEIVVNSKTMGQLFNDFKGKYAANGVGEWLDIASDESLRQNGKDRSPAAAARASSPVGKVELTPVPQQQLAQPVTFGTSGWRAVMDGKQFTLHNAGRVAQAVVSVFQEQRIPIRGRGKPFRFGVTYGGRKMSQEAAQRAVEVLAANGADVVMGQNITTTPRAMALTKKELGANAFDAVLHFDASHNPVEYNGMKFFVDGVVAPDSLTKLIAARANDETSNATYNRIPLFDHEISRIDIAGQSRAVYRGEFPGLVEGIRAYQSRHPGMKMIVDALHGSAGGYLDMFREMGATIIRTEPLKSGTYPKTIVIDGKTESYRPEPVLDVVKTAPEYKVFAETAPEGSLYLAIDGDADRLAVWVKKDGTVKELLPNNLGVLFGWYLISTAKAAGATKIVKTLPTTTGMDALARWSGKELVVTPVGSKHFAPYLGQLVIGVEESGHLVTEKFFDDAVWEALLLLEITTEKDQDAAAILNEAELAIGHASVYRNKKVALTPVLKESLKEAFGKPRELAEKFQQALGQRTTEIFVTTPQGKVVTLDQLEQEGLGINVNEGIHLKFSDGSWVQPRLSGTEFIARIYSEAPAEAQRERLSNAVISVLGIASSPVVLEDSRGDEDDASLVSSLVSETWGNRIRDIYNITDKKSRTAAAQRLALELRRSVDEEYLQSVMIAAVAELDQLHAESREVPMDPTKQADIREKETAVSLVRTAAMVRLNALKAEREGVSSSPISGKMGMNDLPGNFYENKRAFIRPDFNVPLNKDNQITEDTRITESVPTLQYAVEHKLKVIIGAHLGDPSAMIKKKTAELHMRGEGIPEDQAKEQATREVRQKLSLAPVAKRLRELGFTVYFNPNYLTTAEAEQFINETMRPGEILLLENLRFHSGETKKDPEFVRDLFKAVDIRINEGFGAMHRDHASVAGETPDLPIVAGFLLEKEIQALDEIKKTAGVVVMGGSKVSSKIGVIDAFLEMPQVEKILIGGAMANAFLKAKYEDRIDLGASIGVDTEDIAIARRLLQNKKIVIPHDFQIASGLTEDANHKDISLEELLSGAQMIPPTWMIVSIGRSSAREYTTIIRASEKDVFGNGPMGVFELPFAAQETHDVLQAMAAQGKSFVGGGDSVAAIKDARIDPAKLKISTGGGAALEVLEGKVLPGIAALSNKPEVIGGASSPVVQTEEDQTFSLGQWGVKGINSGELAGMVHVGYDGRDTVAIGKALDGAVTLSYDGGGSGLKMKEGTAYFFDENGRLGFKGGQLPTTGMFSVTLRKVNGSKVDVTIENLRPSSVLKGEYRSSSPINVLVMDTRGTAVSYNSPGDILKREANGFHISYAKSAEEVEEALRKSGEEKIHVLISDRDSLAWIARNGKPLPPVVMSSSDLRSMNGQLPADINVVSYERGYIEDTLPRAVMQAAVLFTSALAEQKAPGGIDLNPALLDLQIKRDANFVPLPLPQQPLQQMHIEGFIPVIINISPVTNLPMLLGLADAEDGTQDTTTPVMKAREPEQISALN